MAKGSGKKKKKKKKVWRDEESTFFLDFFIEIVDVDGLVWWRICLHHLCRLVSAPSQLLEEKILGRRKGWRARGPSPSAFFFFGRLPEELGTSGGTRTETTPVSHYRSLDDAADVGLIFTPFTRVHYAHFQILSFFNFPPFFPPFLSFMLEIIK